MHTEYITPFLSSMMEILKTMANTEAKPGRPIKRAAQPASGAITAIIDLTGGTKGSVSITFTEPCIVGVVNNMLGESYTEMNEDIEDAVGELVNMVSGAARKKLSDQGFVFHGGIPRCITGPEHTIDHSVSGVLIEIPFKTEDGIFYIEACFESEEFFEKTKKAQEKAVIKESNSSLLPIKLQGFLGNQSPVFKSYMLKPNSQVMKPNYFLFPDYVEAREGYDACNFTALEINVCPHTYFASNNIKFFKHSNNLTNPLLEDPKLHQFALPMLLETKEKGISIPSSMYTVGRSIENAILAYHLAIRTSEILHKYDAQKFLFELGKVGEYALKAAFLSKLIKSVGREKDFLISAHSAYRKSLSTVSGEQFFRRCFRLVALSIYLENYEDAKAETGVMIKYFREHAEQIKPEEAPKIKRYIQWVDKIYKEKEQCSITKQQDRDNYRFFQFS